MKDNLERTISVGDIIGFTSYGSLQVGWVVGETAGGNPRVYEYNTWEGAWDNTPKAVTYGTLLLQEPHVPPPEEFK